MENQDRIIRQYDGFAGQFAMAANFEKTTIIAPSVKRAFNAAVRDKDFDPEHDKVIDIGCGPFLLAKPLLRDNVHVDGIDITPDMIGEAKQALLKANVGPRIDKNKIKLVSDYSALNEGDYSFAMLNFVHQCCDTRESLVELFNQANRLLQSDSRLLLIMPHPEYLHVAHAAYECDVEDSRTIKDGEIYSGTIYTDKEDVTFMTSDYYWSASTVRKAAEEAGFDVMNIENIADHDSLSRSKSDEPAYMMMTFRKPSPVPAV